MKLTIKAKLAVVFTVFTVTTLLLSLLGMFSLFKINDKNDAIVNNWLPGLSTIKTIDTLVTDNSVTLYRHVTQTSPESMSANERELNAIDQKMQNAFHKYDQLIALTVYNSEAEKKADQEAINVIKGDWQQILLTSKNALALSRANKEQEALHYMVDNVRPIVTAMKERVGAIVQLNEEGSLKIGEEVTNTYNSTKIMFIAIGFIALIIGCVIIYLVGKNILAGIQDLLAVSLEIAKGNLRVNAAVTSDDELGQLAAASNQMVDNTKRLISQIQKIAEQVAASSQELTASADQSAEATQTIAASINNVSSMTSEQVGAVELASSQTNQTAGEIERFSTILCTSAEQAQEALDTAKEGVDTIDGAVRQMNNMEGTVNQLATVVTKLGERSGEIGQIVETISGIAGQTNLLALNAAIEAARAGEMGKGFAVVAEEVRKLAEQSREAAKNIAVLINEIQADTNHAVNAMDKGTQEIKAGTEVVQQAGKAFSKIYSMVDIVNQNSSEMVGATQELVGGTQKVVEAVHIIDESGKNVAAESHSVSAATQEQLASMEEIAAASRCLAGLAQNLSEMSNRFRV